VKLSERAIGGNQGGVDEKKYKEIEATDVLKKGTKSKKYVAHRNRTSDPRVPLNGLYHCATRGCSFSNRNSYI
jgi:hypothetical protein